jgi:hypothetical protein
VVCAVLGAHAPEQEWDDYGDIDLAGKLAIFLVNDPDFAAAAEEDVSGRIGNRRMTYYGRWTYKFEEAARRGARGALIIHETEAAGYSWWVAAAGAGENVSLANKNPDLMPISLQGWRRRQTAASLFASAGYDLDNLEVAARRADFAAFELKGVNFSATLDVKVTW